MYLKSHILLHRGKMGTVGAVAVDIHGNVACATSTGGMLNKMEGRVGDTPCIGRAFKRVNICPKKLGHSQKNKRHFTHAL